MPSLRHEKAKALAKSNSKHKTAKNKDKPSIKSPSHSSGRPSHSRSNDDQTFAQYRHDREKPKTSPSIGAPQDFGYFLRKVGSQILQEVLVFDLPADRCVSDALKKREQLHSRDRSLIRQAIFSYLRLRRQIDFWCTKNIYSSQRRFDIPLFLSLEPSRAPAFFSSTEIEEIRQSMAREPDQNNEQIEVQHNMPEWLYHKLSDQFGDDTLALCQGLNESAPLDLRANRLLTSRDDLLKQLTERSLPVEITPYAPDGLRLKNKQPLEKLPMYEQGMFEVQDEASQLVAHLLMPHRSDWVLDFCAGAGGKTLAIGALMQNRGQVMAVDVSAQRLKRLHPRLARSELTNVQTLWVESEHDTRLDKYIGRFHKVLVDAPCTGLGTLRRNPDLKWRQNELALKELSVKQQEILSRAAMFVKPNGLLVYATCSILREENQAQIEQFLASSPDFEVLPVHEVLSKQNISITNLNLESPYLQLLPHQHQTDGFFAAVLRKKA